MNSRELSTDSLQSHLHFDWDQTDNPLTHAITKEKRAFSSRLEGCLTKQNYLNELRAKFPEITMKNIMPCMICSVNCCQFIIFIHLDLKKLNRKVK